MTPDKRFRAALDRITRESILTTQARISEALAELADSPTATEETGWLIEISGPKWFKAGPTWNWTKDASEALRFARREDAETFGRWSSLDIATGENLQFTEHRWG